MQYCIGINIDNITTSNNISDLCQRNHYFTLTVKAVNDAPVLLQPLEGLEIVEDSGAAAVVLNTYIC